MQISVMNINDIDVVTPSDNIFIETTITNIIQNNISKFTFSKNQLSLSLFRKSSLSL